MASRFSTERPPIEPWQVWRTDFDPKVGREQSGHRPAIVAGTAMACNLLSDLVILIPVTTHDRGLPCQPRVALNQPSVAMCDRIKSVSRDRLHRITQPRISDSEIEEIRFVLSQLIGVQ